MNREPRLPTRPTVVSRLVKRNMLPVMSMLQSKRESTVIGGGNTVRDKIVVH